MTPLLSVRGLLVAFRGRPVVDGASFDLDRGESLALVGASGSGKSTICRAVLGIADDDAHVSATQVLFDGDALWNADGRVRDGLLGRRIGAVFQDPLASLTPHLTIADHFLDAGAAVGLRSPSATISRAREILQELEVDDVDARLAAYPHRLSGGLAQRAALALALLHDPDLLIADEPTTALDSTSRAALLRVLLRSAAARGSALIVVTHDFGVVAGVADRTIVEDAPTTDVLSKPRSSAAVALVDAARRGDPSVSAEKAPA